MAAPEMAERGAAQRGGAGAGMAEAGMAELRAKGHQLPMAKGGRGVGDRPRPPAALAVAENVKQHPAGRGEDPQFDAERIPPGSIKDCGEAWQQHPTAGQSQRPEAKATAE